MSAGTLDMMALAFFAMAGILLTLAVVLYKVWDIRTVRDVLSGRAAGREIERMRGSRPGAWGYAGRSRRRCSCERGASVCGTADRGDDRGLEPVGFRPWWDCGIQLDGDATVHGDGPVDTEGPVDREELVDMERPVDDDVTSLLRIRTAADPSDDDGMPTRMMRGTIQGTIQGEKR